MKILVAIVICAIAVCVGAQGWGGWSSPQQSGWGQQQQPSYGWGFQSYQSYQPPRQSYGWGGARYNYY